MSYIYTNAEAVRVKELFDPVFGEDNYGVNGYGKSEDATFKHMQKILGLKFPPRSYLTANICERSTVSKMIKILQESGFKVALEEQGRISYPNRN